MTLTTNLNKHGLQHLAKQQYDLAEQFFQTAIDHDPTFADAYGNLGVSYFLNHKNDEAIDIFNKSLTLRPNHAETLYNLGYALWRGDNFAAAKVIFEQAALLSDMTAIKFALGSLCYEMGDDIAAIEHTQQALHYEPDNVLAHDTLAEIYYYRGRKDEAIEQCDELIRIAPHDLNHTVKKALVLMTFNDFAGWQQHETRYECSDDHISETSLKNPQMYSDLYNKRWNGQPTGHLLIAREQGFGDIIQMLRFLPMVAERCEKVSLFLPPALRRTAKMMLDKYPNIDVCQKVPDNFDFDHWCLIVSLPYLLNMTTNFPTAPYLIAPKAKYGEIRRLDGLKVGLVWSSDSVHRCRRWRNIPFEKMAQLLDVPVRFVSLQHPLTDDISKYPIIDVHPIQTSINGTMMLDWSETAALIDALDLVITVDTAVAHMAAALGKPVWLLNRYNTDWRWGLKGNDSPWYPSMRIFRQTKMGDWDTVIDAVREALFQRTKA